MPPLDYRDFDMDPGTSRFQDDQQGGEITVEVCKHCGTKWLRCIVKYPAFTASGGWCRGLVSEGELSRITTSNARGFLEQLPWYIYGGSYFNSAGKQGQGTFNADL